MRRRIIENGFAVTQYVARPLADKTVKPLIEEDNEREQRIATREEQELRRKKPHLFNVPQKHKRSLYARSLENNLIAKIKTDSYGRVQRDRRMELHELNTGDDIWFKYQTRPTHSLQLWKNSITTLKANHT